jgi:hypothetical protein
MASIRITSVDPPFDNAALVDPSMRLLRLALALGLIGENETVDRLNVETVRSIALEASAAGIGRDVAVGLLERDLQPSRWALLVSQLAESLAESPLPDRETRELLRVFDRDELSSLLGTSPVSLGRYISGARKWPDDLASRVHWLALVTSDLLGAYNEFGVRRWFGRPRTRLRGRSPREILARGWSPEAPDVERVRELASSLAGVGSAT